MRTTETAGGRTYLPPTEPSDLTRVARLLSDPSALVSVVTADGSTPVPQEIAQIVDDVVRALADGRAITVAPQALRLTSQQAADLLGVSRPTLVRLLENGQIPFEKPSRHRRVLLADVLAYQDRQQHERRRLLDELVADAADSGLYDVPAADYAGALEAARHQRS